MVVSMADDKLRVAVAIDVHWLSNDKVNLEVSVGLGIVAYTAQNRDSLSVGLGTD